MDYCEPFSKINNLRLLIIENDSEKREALSKMLIDRCFNNFEFVGSIARAFDVIKKQLLIDLLIVSPNVPAEVKIDFCTKLRSQPEFKNIRIILEAKQDELKATMPALKLPGVDLICEPINYHNVFAWVRQMAENRVLISDMHSYRDKMQAELDQARQMQNLILPKADNIFNIEEKYRIKVSSYFETCDITGGDFWGLEPISRDVIGFYIVDCTGHGVTAALNTFRMHAVIKDIEDIEIKINPDLFLSYLNKKMCGLFSPGQFATMFYGVIDIKNDVLTYSAAASTEPFMIRDECVEIEKLVCTGYLLGVQKSATYEVHETRFYKGDKILLYSDALIENLNLNGEMYGEERLLASASSVPECKDGVNLMAKIINQFSDYCRTPLADDLTVNIYARM